MTSAEVKEQLLATVKRFLEDETLLNIVSLKVTRQRIATPHGEMDAFTITQEIVAQQAVISKAPPLIVPGHAVPPPQVQG